MPPKTADEALEQPTIADWMRLLQRVEILEKTVKRLLRSEAGAGRLL